MFEKYASVVDHSYSFLERSRVDDFFLYRQEHGFTEAVCPSKHLLIYPLPLLLTLD